MTTKDHCLSSKDKQKIFVNDTSNNQYSNLNLNHKRQNFSRDETVFSKRATRKGLNYDSNDNNFSQTRKNSWNKSNKSWNNLNIGNDFDKPEKLKAKNALNAGNSNNSTLSLHIAAYENSAEITDKFIGKNEENKLDSDNAKQISDDSKSDIQNSFAFPKQSQTCENMEAEVSQFKASQKLLNPNKAGASKSSSQHRYHLKKHGVNQNADSHHHHHYHNHHRNHQHHHTANDYGALDLIFLQNKMYVPSMFHAAQETSLAMTAIRYKQNEIEHQKALALGRSLPSSSAQNYFNPQSSYSQNHAPTWLPLIRILPFTTPQMQSSSFDQVKDKQQHHQNNYQQEQEKYDQHDDNLLVATESISMQSAAEDDNVFLPSGISPIKPETTKPLMKHHQISHSCELSPTQTLSPTLSHSDTLSPSEVHVPIDSLFHGTKKMNKKTNKRRRANVAGKAISLADLESKLIGSNGGEKKEQSKFLK